MAMKLCGYEATRLLVAHGPWSVNLVDFLHYLLLSLCRCITAPILAFQILIGYSSDSLLGKPTKNVGLLGAGAPHHFHPPDLDPLFHLDHSSPPRGGLMKGWESVFLDNAQ